MNKRLLIIIVSVFLVSCANSHTHMTTNKTDINTHKTSTKNIKYTCNRGTELSVNFILKNNDSGKTIAIINGFGEQAIILPKKAVASGFLYSNGKYTLRGKEEHATWTIGRMTPFQCSAGNKLIHQEDIK